MQRIKVKSSIRGTYLIPKSKLAKFRYVNREICRTRTFIDWGTEEYHLSLIEDFGILFNKYEFRRGPEMNRIYNLWKSIFP